MTDTTIGGANGQAGAGHVSITTATEPDGAPRIASLDVMRGIAILGILFMNINAMGGSLWASFGDFRRLGWTQADQIAWLLREVVADGTARCMLEMLFGVGMVILTERAAGAVEASAARPTGRMRRVMRWLFGDFAVMRAYYWRNLVLFGFGLVHIFILLWLGDILHTYGLAAMVAFLFRRMGPKMLLFFGVLMALLQLFGGGISLHMAQQSLAQGPALIAKQDAGTKLTAAETKAVAAFTKTQGERAKRKDEERLRIAQEDSQRSAATGDFTSWAASAWTSVLFIWGVSDGIGEASMLEPLFVWEAAGTMLIGAALFKWGIIQGRRSPRFYTITALIAYAIGFGGRGVEAYSILQFDDFPHMIFATAEVTRLATTLGHIAAIHLVLASVGGARLLKPFEAAGKTALTIYILQTIICLWILYPPFALGLYGKQGWMALMLTALAVNAVLLWAANWWVREYRIAPVEWAWRSIVERRRLPFRHRGRMGAVVPGAVQPA